uniref:Polysaccharide biosynthesis protein n=1 Tax=Thermofilum pendens TaxID=2269 RepID=A0A7C3WL19_THEPE
MGLRLVGALYYAQRLYNVLVGVVFILVVTRNLPPSDFGAWSVISSLLSYATIATLVNYWVTRLRAYGDASATLAGLALAAVFSAASSAALLLLAPGIASAFSIPPSVIPLVLAYIPVLYANSALYSSLYATNPVRAALSEFAFETAKLAAAALLVLLGAISLQGVLLAVLASHLAQALVLLMCTRGDFARAPVLPTARKIISYSWVNAVASLSALIASADVLLISHYASNDAVAYYTVVLAFANVVGYSYFLGRGLYQRLLTVQAGSAAYVEEALRLVLLIGVPTALGALTLAPNLLYILNPVYTPAANVLRAAALAALVAAVNGTLSDAVQGLERIDRNDAKPGELARSKIFRVVLLGYLRSLLGILGVVLALCAARDPLGVALGARLSWLVVEVLALIVLARWVGTTGVRAPYASITRFVVAGLLMSAVVAPLNPLRIREVLLTALLGSAAYFSTLYLLDAWFRSLARQAVSRVFITLSRRSPML